MAISYTAGGASIGGLTYTYDAVGRRTSVGGSLANVAIPTAAMTATYDSDNRMVQYNGAAVTSDADGNVTNDTTNTYTWNARNQLSSLSGQVSGSFQYDAFGRRVQKVISGATTGYLYDGNSFVQEQNSSGAVTAAVLTGGVDETFARMTSSAITVPLTDVLGSVVAETDSSGSVVNNYNYEPYGRTSQSGTTSGNSQQYAGRESDGAGLYYNRARYYSTTLSRCISQDPIGFSGGLNLYAYASGNPVSFRDPTGFCGSGGPRQGTGGTTSGGGDGGGSGTGSGGGGSGGGGSGSGGGDTPGGDTGGVPDNTDATNGQEDPYNPDETGAGNKADRAVNDELARQEYEQQAADDLAKGDIAAYNQDIANAQRMLDRYDSANGWPPVATGGINPSVMEEPDPDAGTGNIPLGPNPNPYRGLGSGCIWPCNGE